TLWNLSKTAARWHRTLEAIKVKNFVLLKDFIYERDRRLWKRLQQIRDELDGNVERQRMTSDSALIAIEIISDGKFNWGRVVSQFFFRPGWLGRKCSHFGSPTRQTVDVFLTGIQTNFLVICKM
uniref:Uncharacterized protein n=1 Tax=Periophthalmus magnuspinnatus TaxID=409849 RepID=A0A3B4B6K5_9GOBI